MKTNTNYSCICFLIAAIFAASCASNPDEFKEIDQAVEKSDFSAGIETVRKGQNRRKPRYNERNAVSLFLDQGILQHYAGQYRESTESLQEAERLIAEAYTKSISANVASYIANDNTKEYPGEDFEDIYLSVFNALNYFNQGNMEGALVEIRKLNWTGSGKLHLLGEKYEGMTKNVMANVMAQLVSLGFSSAPNLPDIKPINFSDSALARYLGALFYLGINDYNAARREFEKVHEAFAANPNIYTQPFPKAVAEAQDIPGGKARLHIIGFTGLSPVKEEEIYHQHFPFFRHVALMNPQFKLPRLARRQSGIDLVEVIIDDETFSLELIEDMGAVIEETFSASISQTFLKTYIRTMLKYAAVDIAAAEATRQSGYELAGELSAIAAKAAFDATEKADIRMSRYFPDRALIGGINLDPGNYTVMVHFYSGTQRVSEKEFNVDVRANRLNLIEVVSLK